MTTNLGVFFQFLVRLSDFIQRIIYDKFLLPKYEYKVQESVKESGRNLSVNGPTYINAETYLGDNVNFNGMRITGEGSVKIGDNFHSGSDCLILTSNHNYNGNKIPYDETSIEKRTVIEDNVWLGTRVTLIPGVKIGEGSIIQAGSVVTKDIPKYAIAGGSPAKIFSYRDKDHYKNLKDKERFH